MTEMKRFCSEGCPEAERYIADYPSGIIAEAQCRIDGKRRFIGAPCVYDDCVYDETISAKADNVNHPVHYTKGGIECIDAIEAATQNLTGAEAVCTGQVIKYIWHWKWKNGVEDLKKSQWYLNRLISKLEVQK